MVAVLGPTQSRATPLPSPPRSESALAVLSASWSSAMTFLVRVASSSTEKPVALPEGPKPVWKDSYLVRTFYQHACNAATDHRYGCSAVRCGAVGCCVALAILIIFISLLFKDTIYDESSDLLIAGIRRICYLIHPLICISWYPFFIAEKKFEC